MFNDFHVFNAIFIINPIQKVTRFIIITIIVKQKWFAKNYREQV